MKQEGKNRRVPHEDHLRLEFAGCVVLLDDLPEVHEQLLDLVVLHGDAKANHGHQQLGRVLAVHNHHDGLLDAFHLPRDVSRFQVSLRLGLGRLGHLVKAHQKRAARRLHDVCVAAHAQLHRKIKGAHWG